MINCGRNSRGDVDGGQLSASLEDWACNSRYRPNSRRNNRKNEVPTSLKSSSTMLPFWVDLRWDEHRNQGRVAFESIACDSYQAPGIGYDISLSATGNIYTKQ